MANTEESSRLGGVTIENEMKFDGEIVKRAPRLMSYLNDFQWRIDDHL